MDAVKVEDSNRVDIHIRSLICTGAYYNYAIPATIKYSIFKNNDQVRVLHVSFEFLKEFSSPELVN